MNKLIDVDNFEKRLWIEYKKTKNSYISSGIALVLGMLNDEPTFTEQELKSDGANEVLNQLRAEMLLEILSHSGTDEEVIQAYADGLKKGLDILDKYKTESEA